MSRSILLPLALFVACDGSTPSARPASAITGLPLELRIAQRRSATVPGTNGRLVLAIDDITRGQTSATLRSDDKLVLLDARSMRASESAEFLYDGQAFLLRLEVLDNRLIGEDFATFSFHARDVAVVDERARIERLLGAIASLERAVFVRNGSEYTAAESVAHLRRKLDSAEGGIRTAEQFIERVATRSSISGKPYVIRFPDGHETELAEFLRTELAKR